MNDDFSDDEGLEWILQRMLSHYGLTKKDIEKLPLSVTETLDYIAIQRGKILSEPIQNVPLSHEDQIKLGLRGFSINEIITLSKTYSDRINNWQDLLNEAKDAKIDKKLLIKGYLTEFASVSKFVREHYPSTDRVLYLSKGKTSRIYRLWTEYVDSSRIIKITDSEAEFELSKKILEDETGNLSDLIKQKNQQEKNQKERMAIMRKTPFNELNALIGKHIEEESKEEYIPISTDNILFPETVIKSNGRRYILMEEVPRAKTLREVIKHKSYLKDRIQETPLHTVTGLLEGLIALNYIGFNHNDLHEENIIFGGFNNRYSPKIIDYSQIPESEGTTRAMKSNDMISVGFQLYRILTGKHIFNLKNSNTYQNKSALASFRDQAYHDGQINIQELGRIVSDVENPKHKISLIWLLDNDPNKQTSMEELTEMRTHLVNFAKSEIFYKDNSNPWFYGNLLTADNAKQVLQKIADTYIKYKAILQ